jgi:hypothetical protein
MKLIIVIISYCCVLNTVLAQNTSGIYLYSGGTTGLLSFEGFESFVASYNSFNQSNGPTKPLAFNRISLGYMGGGYLQLGKFVTGINASHLSTLPSTAAFGENQTRAFQFRYNSFDLLIGARFGSSKIGCIPYLTLTTQSMQLYSWYEYADGVKSFGNETAYSGVYNSWKSVGKLGLRLTVENNHWGFYVDSSLPLTKNEYLGGSFEESSSATDSNYFPAYAGQSQVDAITDGLKESYRQFIFGLGVSYKLGFEND